MAASAIRLHQASVVCIVALAASTLLSGVSGWKTGRATFYGNEPWYWSIHHGSCGKGYQWPDQGTGWDVAALSDSFSEYQGSCGRCYEVKCNSMSFKDGYGDSLSRDGVCKDSESSVVVTVTDTCPCHYSNNYYSNKRWCCGDMDHFDLSVWAFEKLADMKWGVISIQYRQVDCGYQPYKKASGTSWPGEFPPMSQAKDKDGGYYYQYFPNGGYCNSRAGDGSWKLSASDFVGKIGKGK